MQTLPFRGNPSRMGVQIVAVSQRPDLAPLVARWRVDVFFNRSGGYTAEEMNALSLAPPVGSKETFVLFDSERPVGTAG